MAGLVDLTKKVAVVLEKRALRPEVKAQVGFAVDVSGSMKDMYRDGTMQEVVNRVQAIATRFDDNQTLDMWNFHNVGFSLPAATPEMFGTYVKQHILSQSNLWGGTSFAPVTALIAEHYFAPKKSAVSILGSLFSRKKAEASDLPVYLIFLTDGDNDDELKTTALLQDLQEKNIYVQFVGVGRGSSFRYVRRMAEAFDHVGFVDFSDPAGTTDEQMYDELLSKEFVDWMNSHAK